VRLQGETALAGLDLMKAAGGRNRAIAREFRGVQIGQELRVELIPAKGSKQPALLSGIEIQAE
jgi:hypothetical protein